MNAIEQLALEVGNFDEVMDVLSSASLLFVTNLPAPTAGYLDRAYTRRWKRELRVFVRDLVRHHLTLPATAPPEMSAHVETLAYAVVEHLVEADMDFFQTRLDIANEVYSTMPEFSELFREDVYEEWRSHADAFVAERMSKWIEERTSGLCSHETDVIVEDVQRVVIALVDQMVAEEMAS